MARETMNGRRRLRSFLLAAAGARDLPAVLLVLGLGGLAAALLSDLVGLGKPGVGRGQVALAGLGLGACFTAAGLDRFVGGARLGAWVREVARARGTGKVLALLVQLFLLLLVMRTFQIENKVFYTKLAGLIFLGFLVHSFLPRPYRLPFFLVLSLAALGLVFGWREASWLVLTGLLLISICHLPLGFAGKALVLCGAGGVLAALRAQWLPVPWSQAVWPILGSMFMFRTINYLYVSHHEKRRPTISGALAYFLLLPNVVFPLFPVVDYQTFRRTYYDGEEYAIYQRGVSWILRGVTHLLLYRAIYYHLMGGAEEVRSLNDLLLYMLANYSLYLRVSGQFHLIVGVLHLFGFHLPETHHRYFLAASFTDFWRRINIYWKDFMLKVFFYPAYFRLRRLGEVRALVLATLFVFALTWFFHAYQWFWLRGSFPLGLVDILFWSALALLVVADSLRELRRGRARTLGQARWTLGGFLSRWARTAVTFAVICVLWSLWTSASLRDWLSLWSLDEVRCDATTLWIAAGVLGFLGAGVALEHWSATRSAASAAAGTPSLAGGPSFARSAAVSAALTLFLYVAGQPAALSFLGKDVQAFVRDFRVAGLNPRDAALMQRGYYEDLIGVDRFNSQLWEIYMQKEREWPKISETEVSRATGDFLKLELRPLSAIVFHGAPLRTNRWGMRDQDYERDRRPGTYRIALLGASHEMGSGVADGETFEALLEERLNEEASSGTRRRRYEILNFAVASYTPLQYLRVLERKVFDFAPDAVFYSAHPSDAEFIAQHLLEMAAAGIEVPYASLRDLVERAGVTAETPEPVAARRLKAISEDLVAWVYGEVARRCRARGVLAVWILAPTPGINVREEELDRLRALADRAGFAVIDVADVFRGRDVEDLQVAAWDWHPNAEGHRLIAARLYDALREKRAVIPLWGPGPVPTD